ncbi:diacylglycerol kinase [Furfurilactobacillus curtus]|uniref:Diacylglycerol kinase n=1 Tax=Furfurilactobacillus curtus TaxID=1746200 RepID=A0ABQ5JNY3_9LACO
MAQRARVIYNPTSGREALKRDLIDILNVFEQAGYETSAFATTPAANSAKNEARRAAKAGFDLIVAAGGDGTINEVVNGIANLRKRPKMAIIPAGTTNDYARALRIPRDEPLAAAKVVLKNQTVKMDIGQAGDTYFINIAGGGLLTELTYDVPSDMKTIFGYLAYLVKGAELLPQIKPIQMSIEYDDGKFEGEASMFLLGLTNSIGGFEQIVPEASLDDGKFSLLIVKTASMPQLLRLMTLVLNGGRHINDPHIIYKKTRKVIAKPLDQNDRMMINLDGEYGGDAPMTFIDHKQHIEMFADLDAIPDEQITGEDRAIEADARKFVEEVDKLPQTQTDSEMKA